MILSLIQSALYFRLTPEDIEVSEVLGLICLRLKFHEMINLKKNKIEWFYAWDLIFICKKKNK